MTSGKRTPDYTLRAMQRLVRQKNADGKRLMSYEDIAKKLQIDRHIVFDEVWRAACAYWAMLDWKDDPLNRG